MRQKRRKPAGSLADLQRVMWKTILEVEELLDTRPASNDLVLRASHALAQLANAYKSVTEMASIEERLSALERATAADRNGHP